MSDSRSPKEDHRRSHPGASQVSEEIQQKAREARETAQDTVAQTHTVLSRTRQLLKQTEEIGQYRQARREYEAEHATFHAMPAPRVGIDILLIEDNPADVALFRYVLHECALPCRLTVLSRRSDVKAFFAQATTAAYLSLPRLIIADCMIPGMEAEDIVAAVRTVPAYHHVPVILFSTLPEAEGQRRYVQCGATAFVQKPGELQAFVETVATMVRRWSGTGGGSDVPLANSQ
jgi:two-component system, chemotaxis family, response regulator Rcp1